jgi:two-component system NarL family sensor kinase
MRRKDGSLFPSEQNITLIRGGPGQLIGWITVVRDITERMRAEADLRMLSRSTIEVQEAERSRIARELHDGVNQMLASVKMRLRKVDDLLHKSSPAAREILSRCQRLLGLALEENRDLSHNLHPQALSDLGLKTACRDLCNEVKQRSKLVLKCRFVLPSTPLPAAVELNLFRVLQEALNNLEKHARAKHVWVRLVAQSGSIVLQIRDDGRGFRPAVGGPSKGKQPGIGLANMHQRAMSIGGTCQVESAPSKGTIITVRVPLP